MRAITADYQERIVIPPEDVIPKSSWFKFVKCSLIVALSMLVVLAVITLIVAESFVSSKHKDGLAIGIVSLVGIILFLVGMVAILKEHIPLILTFSVAMIIYLLIFMYSRVITSPGLLILRTFILLLLAVEAFCFCIMIRDWRALQVSRLNQRMMKEAQLAHYAAANGMMPPSSHIMNTGYGLMSQQPYGHHQQQQSHIHGNPLAHNQRGYPNEMTQYNYQFNQPQGQNYNRAQADINQYGPSQYGPTSGQYDQNPYITIEDENPYAQIGESTNRQTRRSTTNTGHIYNQPKINAPRY